MKEFRRKTKTLNNWKFAKYEAIYETATVSYMVSYLANFQLFKVLVLLVRSNFGPKSLPSLSHDNTSTIGRPVFGGTAFGGRVSGGRVFGEKWLNGCPS